MSNRVLTRLAALLFVLTLLTGCFISRTFAIYANKSEGSFNLGVKTWSFEVNDSELSTSDTFSFNLFGTDATNVIAPGFSGSIPLKFKNTSEVAATYKITLSTTNSVIPLEYSTDGSSYSRTLPTISGNLNSKNLKTVTLYWRWSKNAYTSTDKTLQNSSQTITITADAEARQTVY